MDYKKNYYDNGQLRIRGNFVNDLEEGVFIGYGRKNGTGKSTEYYINGKKVSKRSYFKQKPNEKEQ